MKRAFQILLFLAVLVEVRAVADFTLASVPSSHNGNGLFTYTLSTVENSQFFWHFTGGQGGGGLIVPSYGVEEIISPPGWHGFFADGWVQWGIDGGSLVLESQPLTFSIRS